MRIVCGTDFSDNAAVALRAAAAVAARAQGSIEIVHVHPATEEHVREEVALAKLEALAAPLRNQGRQVTTRLLEGTSDEALVEHAANADASLLVVGALGERSGVHWFVGSTTERVAQASRVPVLVVRGADAFEAWAAEDRPLRILVGADLSPSADAAVRWARDLTRLGPSRATLAHVYWPPEEHARLGIKGSMSMVERHPEVERVLARDLAARLDAADLAGMDIRIEHSFGRVGDALAMIAAREASDLVVVGTRQRGGFVRLWHGSVSSAALDAATASVVCVPLTEAESDDAKIVVPSFASVLAPTDFSEIAARAVAHAYAAVDDGGWVHLLHVHEPDSASRPNPLYAHYVPSRAPAPDERRRDRSELVERLEALAPPAAERRGIRTQAHVVESPDVVATIEATGERLGVSLICLGSHGRSQVVRALLGSVAQGVVSASRRPVLVVPAG